MSDPFSNPITKAIADITARLADMPADKLASLEVTATLEPGDWARLGDMASRALISGHIDQSVAQSLHAIHSRFNGGASLAERLVFLQCASELLARR